MRNFTHSTMSEDRRAAINAHNPLRVGKKEIEMLGRIVTESIRAFSVTTHLAQNKVVDILGKINVDTLDDVQAAVENLIDVEGIDTIRIAVAVEETIKAIAAMTNLGAKEISKILTENVGASVEDIVLRLHEESRMARLQNT